jgi:hypothetical protein
MSVYVDPLTHYGPGFYHGPGCDQAARVGARNGHLWCQLFADTTDELHAFAGRIGLVRSWFRGDYYDLTPKRRVAAVAAGALEVDRRTLAKQRIQRKVATFKRFNSSIAVASTSVICCTMKALLAFCWKATGR